MTSSSDARGLLSRGEWRGGGCWREIAPWCIVGTVPTASLEVLSVVTLRNAISTALEEPRAPFPALEATAGVVPSK